jgi:hypothetical protein
MFINQYHDYRAVARHSRQASDRSEPIRHRVDGCGATARNYISNACDERPGYGTSGRFGLA